MESNLVGKSNCKYNFGVLLAFNRTHMYADLKNIVITIVVLMLLASTFAFSGMSAFFKGIISIVTVFWFLNLLLLPFLWTKASYNKKQKVVTDYEFYRDKMKITTYINDKKKEKLVVDYQDLDKVIFGKRYMYFYLNESTAYICSRKKFDGDIRLFKSIFKRRMGRNFVEKG